MARAHPAVCILSPETDSQDRQPRCFRNHFLRCLDPCRLNSAMPCDDGAFPTSARRRRAMHDPLNLSSLGELCSDRCIKVKEGMIRLLSREQIRVSVEVAIAEMGGRRPGGG